MTQGPDPRIMAPSLVSPAESERLAWEQAEAAGSSAALIQFLARNPDSPFAEEARARLAARRSPDPPGTAERVAGTDADVVEAFDRARLAGPDALRGFLAQHGTHPLAEEARRLLDGQ
ncbi:hypothetical protein [Rubellimicrobium sp. CFH 75288]|uniref:hypothetical protein n=1 Tax=Rubellimicrobium sp. CFH 75288 TaxID=2697034 RepID=UPI001412E6E0|nr:hypothetical protein [Rubellimicrobium sp. CFH 75288]NAZ38175.1 hypothetical protein [Rubellimicrobium sp. CFH 75288]